MRIFVVGACLLMGCSTPEDTCDAVEPCTPQYEPTFDNIHSRTVVPSCATGGGACHASPMASGGFDLTSIDIAYDEFSARAASTCDTLGARITSDNRIEQMPPGMPLSDGEQCAILQWVEAGAPR